MSYRYEVEQQSADEFMIVRISNDGHRVRIADCFRPNTAEQVAHALKLADEQAATNEAQPTERPQILKPSIDPTTGNFNPDVTNDRHQYTVGPDPHSTPAPRLVAEPCDECKSFGRECFDWSLFPTRGMPMTRELALQAAAGPELTLAVESLMKAARRDGQGITDRIMLAAYWQGYEALRAARGEKRDA